MSKKIEEILHEANLSLALLRDKLDEHPSTETEAISMAQSAIGQLTNMLANGDFDQSMGLAGISAQLKDLTGLLHRTNDRIDSIESQMAKNKERLREARKAYKRRISALKKPEVSENKEAGSVLKKTTSLQLVPVNDEESKKKNKVVLTPVSNSKPRVPILENKRSKQGFGPLGRGFPIHTARSKNEFGSKGPSSSIRSRYLADPEEDVYGHMYLI